jgi:hypothetical protein
MVVVFSGRNILAAGSVEDRTPPNQDYVKGIRNMLNDKASGRLVIYRQLAEDHVVPHVCTHREAI